MVKKYTRTNITQNKSFIYINRLGDARYDRVVDSAYWNESKKYNLLVSYTKYQIKETDLQQKTATFTSTDYYDLTTGLYTILISSPYHENFAGIILSVEYDKREGLYTYQCQDWSRLYQGKVNLMCSNVSYYNILRTLISQRGVKLSNNPSKTQLKQYKKRLSGLRPLKYYNMGWWGNSKKFNPLEAKKKVLIKDKTYIEAIRDIVYGAGGYIKVYFSQNGVIQIEPYSRSEWLKNGIYVTTQELASEKFTFDTTNVITGVIVASNENKVGTGYSSKELVGLDLTAFFGDLGAEISNPNKSTTSTKTSTTKTTTENSVNGTPVHINTDRIGSASQDQQMLKDLKKLLEKKGYKVTLGARNPNAHYTEINKVKKNGIYFTIYGGLCAGTINEQCTSNHFWNVLKKKNAKMVIGHKEPNKTTKWRLTNKLTWLPRAHDDNFSPRSFKGIKNPLKMMQNKGIGVATGLNAKEIASNFPNFKGNTTNKSSSKSEVIISNTDSNNITKEKSSAIEEIGKPIRDFLNLKVTIPLGNPSLKNIHTNMFLYTELPKEFTLTNFKTIADAIKSKYSRYTGYTLNRWYIEGVTITNDGVKFTMDLDLNPFPTPLIDYVENKKKYTSDYDSKSTSNTKSSTKETTKKADDNHTNLGFRSDGKGACNDTFYLTTKKGQNNISKLVNKSENKLSQEKIGKTGTNYHKFVKNCKTAKEVYKKLCTIIPLKNASYANTKYKCPQDAFNHPTNLNCAEKSRLFKSCCDSLNIPCVIYHVENHYMNGVLINGKWQTADLCYRSGIRHKDYNTAHFNK